MAAAAGLDLNALLQNAASRSREKTWALPKTSFSVEVAYKCPSIVDDKEIIGIGILAAVNASF